jgi:hypothetical protein
VLLVLGSPAVRAIASFIWEEGVVGCKSMQSVDAVVDPFDRRSGNGSSSSGDDWLDSESIFRNEWGSSAATTFNPADDDGVGESIPDSKRARLRRLEEWHNGKAEENRAGSIRRSYILQDARLFMSVLDMPSSQRDIVLDILQNLDISSNNFGGRRYEKIILAICSLVSDEFLTDQPNPSLKERLFMRDSFRDLMRVCGMSSADHRKLRVSVREKSDYFEK